MDGPASSYCPAADLRCRNQKRRSEDDDRNRLAGKAESRCIVVGAGKASAAMAAGLDAAWPDVDLSGVVVTRHGHSVPAGCIEVIEASHPVPDETSKAAALRMLSAVRGLSADDLVIALMSGGGSALMTLPAPPMTLADKQAVNRALLASGATIAEMNVVRKHLSAIKGGRLALAARPARLTTLVISDIPGDDLAAIASGPTLPDASTKSHAQEIVGRFAIDLPEAARLVLEQADETPKPGGLDADVRLLAAPFLALDAAANIARAEGLTPIILGDAIEGEARELGTVMADIARSVATRAQPAPPPRCCSPAKKRQLQSAGGRQGEAAGTQSSCWGLLSPCPAPDI
jgi:glycerate 2-kinase